MFQPTIHATDVWLGATPAGPGEDRQAVRVAERQQFLSPPVAAVLPPVGVGDGFRMVGDVAVVEGDDETTIRQGSGFGMRSAQFAELTRRFIAAFGDDYSEVAVFLSFPDVLSRQALAYQQPIKNDDDGLGLPRFDFSSNYGSAGTLETVLNMKQINIYGRDVTDDAASDLYAVWAQEAAHRWLIYFRYQRAGDKDPSKKLLGREDAHWGRFVQADGSLIDGYTWKDNGDGTFTPGDFNKRYGALDQYGMGLRRADEVPPFFLLEDVMTEDGQAVGAMGRLSRTGRYHAKKIDLTVADIVRAVGPRKPEIDVVAQNLRMAVLLLGRPGQSTASLVGEAQRIDNTRRLWTDFYNEAGGGRGRICTTLLRPCRGDAWTFDEESTADASVPGGAIRVTVRATNVGTETGILRVRAQGRGFVDMAADVVTAPAPLAPGAVTTLSFPGQLPKGVRCGRPLQIDLVAAGRFGPSRAALTVVPGLIRAAVDDLEGPAPAVGWRINPDGTDTGKDGRWAWGAPKRSQAFDVVLQPGAAYSGQNAFATGLLADETDNVEGTTTLESPEISWTASGAAHLSYRLYFVSADFDKELIVPSPAGSLSVLASVAGAPFVQVDRVDGLTVAWQRRLVRLSDKLGSVDGLRSVRLRFVAAEEPGAKRPVVEAVIDDVGIFTEAAGCQPVAADAPAPLDLPTGITPAPLSVDGGWLDAGPVLDAGAKTAHGPAGCDCVVGVGGRGGAVWAPVMLGCLALALRRRCRR